MGLHTWMTLGRISNLPSVWTNILAAVLLAQASMGSGLQLSALQWPSWQSTLLGLGTTLALSLMYLGGMFLNDAFDANWDKQHKQQRPIVTGDASVTQVWGHGIAMLLLGICLIGALYQRQTTSLPYLGWLGACMLASAILLYNGLHKRIQHSIVFMGMCRLGVYLLAALLLAQITPELLLAAAALCFYICGVTYSAQAEHTNQLRHPWALVLVFLPLLLTLFQGYTHGYFWLFAGGFAFYLWHNIRRHLFGNKINVGAFIGRLLAGIPLLDGLVLASINLVVPSLLCLVVFLLMPGLQRWIRAT